MGHVYLKWIQAGNAVVHVYIKKTQFWYFD